MPSRLDDQVQEALGPVRPPGASEDAQRPQDSPASDNILQAIRTQNNFLEGILHKLENSYIRWVGNVPVDLESRVTSTESGTQPQQDGILHAVERAQMYGAALTRDIDRCVTRLESL